MNYQEYAIEVVEEFGATYENACEICEEIARRKRLDTERLYEEVMTIINRK